jgi:hypothetical protein
MSHDIDSGDFGEMKCLFSTTPEVGKGTEVTEVTGRCTERGHGLTGRVRSVQRSSQARGLRVATGASGHSRDRSVRSGTQRNSAWRRAERTRGASGHT